jgi:D-ribose pyranase
MKKIGTLNAQLSRVIAAMGHGDRLVICDSGLPIPHGKEVVDLALTSNIPRFAEVLAVVLEELEIESAVVAEEMPSRNPTAYEALQEMIAEAPVAQVPHETFKQMTCETPNTAFVRTGEATPYANVILISGVTFD